ncbi:MAG TPA: hypothetical protein VL383_08305 [Gemmatimonadaceae bacterium]|jgi:hypothetical protein|nr:hypothetical protein [Gemmatimonadaceae bacterium]
MSADEFRNERADVDPSALPQDRTREVDRDIVRDAAASTPVADREVARPRADRQLADIDESDRIALFEPGQLDEFNGRWTEIQAGFVDEPRRAVQQADTLVSDVISRIADSFSRERTQLEQQWDRGGDVSTEDLRQALQRYRSFFSRLLSL